MPAPTVSRLGRTSAAAALIALVVVVLRVVSSSPTRTHSLYVTLPDATNVIPGQYLRAAGQDVGSIGAMTVIDRGRAVRLRLDLDSAIWPLHEGATMTLRWGGTVSYDNRYIEITQGPARNAPYATGDEFPARDFVLPVELDTLLTAFTPSVRTRLKTFLDNAGTALRSARTPLRDTLARAPAAATQLDDVLGDLDASEATLNDLLVSTGRVVNAVDTSDPGLATLLQGAGNTLTATGQQARAIETTLSLAPDTLTRVRGTLRHAGSMLSAAGRLAVVLAPGVHQLRLLAQPLDTLLGTVSDVAPVASTTLASVRAAAPHLTALLSKVTDLSPAITSIGSQAVSELKCVRPYTPDITAFFSDWGDFLSGTDGVDKYIRAQLQVLVPAPDNADTATSAQAAKEFPGLQYGFPRPPGTAAGQPWYQPQCGAGPNALNAADDPESR